MGSRLCSALSAHMTLLIRIILLVSGIQWSHSQCFLNPSISTRPSNDRVYSTDVMDLQTIFESVLDYVGIIKDEFWAQNDKTGQNLTITSPGDGSCAILDEGLSLQTFTTKDSPILTVIPVLTNVVRLSSNRFYIPSGSKSVLLNITQFDELTSHLRLTLDLVKAGPHNYPSLNILRQEICISKALMSPRATPV